MQYFCVTIPPAVRPTLFTTDGYGIFNNMRTNLGVCRTHEGGSGTNKSAQELTRRDRKTAPHPAPLWDRTNPGSLDLNSGTLTTELRPPSSYVPLSIYPSGLTHHYNYMSALLAAAAQKSTGTGFITNLERFTKQWSCL